jgi:ATP-dependent protease ClpP protease subunit
MYNHLSKLILIPLILLLNGCGGVSIQSQVEKANIILGDEPNRVIGYLGEPTKNRSEPPYTVLSYCKTQSVDYLYDYVFRDNKLIYVNSYTNRALGPCSSFFQPIEWNKVEEAYEKSVWKSSIYNIDTLKITHVNNKEAPNNTCYSGYKNKLIVEGTIGPDSSFAVERLLQQIAPCADRNGIVIEPTIVSLKSGGGFLKDGYSLGRTLRKFNTSTLVENDSICASSCAVAFLGGASRSLEENGSILFHAPYLKINSYQPKPDIKCTKDKKLLKDLLDYYSEMLGDEAGKRIFDRTMWYCSAEDGWIVTGGNAAKLFEIATEN